MRRDDLQKHCFGVSTLLLYNILLLITSFTFILAFSLTDGKLTEKAFFKRLT